MHQIKVEGLHKRVATKRTQTRQTRTNEERYRASELRGELRDQLMN